MSKLSMDVSTQMLMDIMQQPGNDACADCNSPSPRWASHNLGIFLCVHCASIHRKLGTHISNVKSINMDQWTKDQIDSIRITGNLNSNAIHNPTEVEPPMNRHDSERSSELEKYIRDKYEFCKFMSLHMNHRAIIEASSSSTHDSGRVDKGRQRARELSTAPVQASNSLQEDQPRKTSPALTTKSPVPPTDSPAPPTPLLPLPTTQTTQKPPLQMLAPSPQPPLQVLATLTPSGPPLMQEESETSTTNFDYTMQSTSLGNAPNPLSIEEQEAEASIDDESDPGELFDYEKIDELVFNGLIEGMWDPNFFEVTMDSTHEEPLAQTRIASPSVPSLSEEHETNLVSHSPRSTPLLSESSNNQSLRDSAGMSMSNTNQSDYGPNKQAIGPDIQSVIRSGISGTSPLYGCSTFMPSHPHIPRSPLPPGFSIVPVSNVQHPSYPAMHRLSNSRAYYGQGRYHSLTSTGGIFPSIASQHSLPGNSPGSWGESPDMSSYIQPSPPNNYCSSQCASPATVLNSGSPGDQGVVMTATWESYLELPDFDMLMANLKKRYSSEQGIHLSHQQPRNQGLHISSSSPGGAMALGPHSCLRCPERFWSQKSLGIHLEIHNMQKDISLLEQRAFENQNFHSPNVPLSHPPVRPLMPPPAQVLPPLPTKSVITRPLKSPINYKSPTRLAIAAVPPSSPPLATLASRKRRRSIEDDAEAVNKRLRSYEACNHCRLKKIKCDFGHPICSACAAVGVTCQQEDRHGNKLQSRAHQEFVET
ncbi:hypothetical protein FRC20_000408 [Serendipita sp. 405]|nr:hypothetical protein FRC15_011494 [Serendipita sp. 397]KAG8801452.1 hypothetical protein FRC16_000445 [Serendipita sp. 398]KAG8870089.1 hypothetical protein FRC20_000408 [Serendipita sp. 405]